MRREDRAPLAPRWSTAPRFRRSLREALGRRRSCGPAERRKRDRPLVPIGSRRSVCPPSALQVCPSPSNPLMSPHVGVSPPPNPSARPARREDRAALPVMFRERRSRRVPRRRVRGRGDEWTYIGARAAVARTHRRSHREGAGRRLLGVQRAFRTSGRGTGRGLRFARSAGGGRDPSPEVVHTPNRAWTHG